MARYRVRNHNAFDVKVGAITLIGGREQEFVTANSKAFDGIDGLSVTLISEEDEVVPEASDEEMARLRGTDYVDPKSTRPDGAEDDDDDDKDDKGVVSKAKSAVSKAASAVKGAVAKAGSTKKAKPAGDDGHNQERQKDMSKPHDTSVTTGANDEGAVTTHVTEALDPSGTHTVGGGGGHVRPEIEGEHKEGDKGFLGNLADKLTGKSDDKK